MFFKHGWRVVEAEWLAKSFSQILKSTSHFRKFAIFQGHFRKFPLKMLVLSEYISWLIARFSNDADAYFAALGVFSSGHIKVHQHPLIFQAQWAEWKIPLGIVLGLVGEINNFNSNKVQSRSSSYVKSNKKVEFV